jgi:hypothetical protein
METAAKLRFIQQLDPQATVVQDGDQYKVNTCVKLKVDNFDVAGPTKGIGTTADLAVDNWWKRYVDGRMIWEALLVGERLVNFNSLIGDWRDTDLDPERVTKLLEENIVIRKVPDPVLPTDFRDDPAPIMPMPLVEPHVQYATGPSTGQVVGAFVNQYGGRVIAGACFVAAGVEIDHSFKRWAQIEKEKR